MLPNGNILIYDNGTHRQHDPMPASRVIEVDPKTNDIFWGYRDKQPHNVFSPYLPGAGPRAIGNVIPDHLGSVFSLRFGLYSRGAGTKGLERTGAEG